MHARAGNIAVCLSACPRAVQRAAQCSTQPRCAFCLSVSLTARLPLPPTKTFILCKSPFFLTCPLARPRIGDWQWSQKNTNHCPCQADKHWFDWQVKEKERKSIYYVCIYYYKKTKSSPWNKSHRFDSCSKNWLEKYQYNLKNEMVATVTTIHWHCNEIHIHSLEAKKPVCI